MNDYHNIFSPGEVIGEAPLFRFLVAAGVVVVTMFMIGLIAFIIVEMIVDEVDRAEQAKQDESTASAGQMDPLEAQAAPDPEILTELTPEQLLTQFAVLTPPNRSILDGTEPVPFLCFWKTPPRRPNADPPLLPQLEIDGFQVVWKELIGKNIWLVHVPLTPGRHEYWTAGVAEIKREIHVIRRNEDAESSQAENLPMDLPMDPTTAPHLRKPAPVHGRDGWRMVCFHPGAYDPGKCDDCHESRDAPDLIPRKSETVSQYRGIGKPGNSRVCIACHAEIDFEWTHQHKPEPLRDCMICHVVHASDVAEPGLLIKPKKNLCTSCHEPH